MHDSSIKVIFVGYGHPEIEEELNQSVEMHKILILLNDGLSANNNNNK